MCHTSDICVLCMVTSVTWSWPWTELNIKHLLISVLPYISGVLEVSCGPKLIILRSLRLVTWKPPILTFDLTLTWHVTSFGKFRGCFRIVSSRAFERRIVRLSAAIRSRVMTWGRLTPLPSKSRVAKYPSKCRVKDAKKKTFKMQYLRNALAYRDETKTSVFVAHWRIFWHQVWSPIFEVPSHFWSLISLQT